MRMLTSTRTGKRTSSKSDCATGVPSQSVRTITTTVTVTLNHTTTLTERASSPASSQVQLITSSANINVIIGVSGGLGGAVFLIAATLILVYWWRKRRQVAFKRRDGTL